MRSRYVIRDADSVHFITSTIVNWLPVFSSAACCDIIVHALLHARERKAMKIYAWVILNNHFHAILSAPDLSGTLRGFKGFTAQALLQQIKLERREWLLHQLADGRAAHKTASVHQVWQEGTHPQAIGTDAMMRRSWIICTIIL